MGDHDLLILLANRYQWTPDQVGRMDPDFLEELLIHLNAADDHQRDQERRKSRNKR